MRFKKGYRVEVMKTENNFPNSWRCAEIVSGNNGHTYLVKFDNYLEFTKEEEAVYERVSEKVIRPCPPPPVEDIELRFVAGDVVEVFDYGSWFTATIMNVLNKGCYSVMLLGSYKELRIHKSRIRVRLSWQHERWVNVGQGSRLNQHLKPGRVRIILKFKGRQFKNDFLPSEDMERFRKKLDDGVGEKGKHYSSFNDYDDNDDTCSVGSSFSVVSDSKKNGLRNDNRKHIGAKVRALERCAYRRTLEALYASGPLSWENEAMLTNLRMTLHISNDEHLVELRNLMSSGVEEILSR